MPSVYIHIPFCNSICSYCDFCKLKYDKKWVNDYLDSLYKEIKEVYKGEKINTLYIGGGTPSSLSTSELNKLFDIIKLFDLSSCSEFTIECNIESITAEKLILFKRNKVNRLSIGVQTFNNRFLKLLNRNHTTKEVFDKIEIAKEVGFDNINVDLIYALVGESMSDIKYDIDKLLELDINHISCYSLMIEKNTKLYIDNYREIDEDIDYEMYNYIDKRLRKNGYEHYEISNYAKKGFKSKHNLVYWNNSYYYGFGLSASGYLNGYRYDNTKNYSKYISHNFVDNIEKISNKDKLKYELILGFRKLEGINKEEFKSKFNKDIHDVKNIDMLLKKNMLKENTNYIYIPEEWIYKSNEILVYFV